MLRYILSFISVLIALCPTYAQEQQQEPQRKKLVVIDIETKVPMRGVIVSTKDGYRDTTNWRGICYVPAKFDTLTVFRHNYIPEHVLARELKDTTSLIPTGSSIGEVTVWGKNDINQQIKKSVGYNPLPSAKTGVIGSFDLANILDRRGRRDRKHLRSVRRKFQEMDNTGDPIVDAYNKAMEKKRLEEEAKEDGKGTVEREEADEKK